MKLAGLASNRGRNLLHIDEQLGNVEFDVILSNHADAPVLEAAEERGISTEVVERGDDESREAHEERVLDALEGYDADLVCLDGYMRVLTESFLDAAPTTINVHPSLLPAFPGMDAHEQVIESGARVTGCTVHLVTEEVDGGPILTQETVPVHEDDTVEDLKERVLYEAEFAAYPRVVNWFAEGKVEVDGEDVSIEADRGGDFPVRRTVNAERASELRYGENPHQDAAVYQDRTTEEPSVVGAEQLNEGAKALSYNNYNDADGALNLIKEFEEPAAAVIKHTNPAGAATADSLAQAYRDALSTDAKSAFGGIVALNRPCDEETASEIIESFKEVVVAPGYTDAALDTLFEKDNLRVLDVGGEGEAHSDSDASSAERSSANRSSGRGPREDGDEPRALGPEDMTERFAEKPLVGGRLVQERNRSRLTAEDLEVVTEREPTDEQVESMLFAWHTLKHVKSNGILFASGTETVSLGVGQVSRVDAVEIAKMKAEKDAEGKSAEGAVMASDAFFPFPDGITAAAEAGIEAVIQPGGSVNDDDVIEAADEHDMAMVMTGERCFRHD